MQSRARTQKQRGRVFLSRRLVHTLPLLVASIAACATPIEQYDPGSIPQEATTSMMPASEPAAPSWCAVSQVLADKCQRCHSSPPQHGAPFALVTYEDTQIQSAKAKPRYTRIAKVVANDSMPPSYIELDPPAEPLSEAERALLTDWCEQGAPFGDEDCAP